MINQKLGIQERLPTKESEDYPAIPNPQTVREWRRLEYQRGNNITGSNNTNFDQ